MTDKKAKTGRTKSPAHTGWSGGKGYLRRGTRIGGERLRGERLELKKKTRRSTEDSSSNT